MTHLPRCFPHPPGEPDHGDGRLHLGPLERVMWRQWPPGSPAPSPPLVDIIRTLAGLPIHLKHELATGMHQIFVGPGGVPNLDDMQHLRGRLLPSGRGRWDDCAGAYVDRFMVLGDRPTTSPDVALHETGHALDDLRGRGDRMLSDEPLWGAVYRICAPSLMLPVHLLPPPLGPREFWADAFAALRSGATVELMDWMSGDRELVLLLRAYFREQFPETDGW
jgi:hypothetical protein